MELLEIKKVEIHENGHSVSPIKENGEWDFTFANKIQNIKAFLQDVKALQKQYVQFKEEGTFEKMNFIYSHSNPSQFWA